MKVNGATLVLHENGSTAEELSNLLTARFGASEASASRAVALEDATTALVFPLNVVAARPDFAAQSERLLVLFSWTPETILLQELRQKGLLTDQEVRTLTPLTEDPYVTAAFEVFREEGDESDLVDTLQRIVAIRVGGPQKPVGASSASTSGQSPSKQNLNKARANSDDRMQTLSGNALLEQLTAALKLEAFPQAELRKLAGSLRSSGKLNRDEEAVVIQLINKELPHLQAAYEIYMEEKDENAFVHSLKRVARHFGVERVVRGQPYARAILDAFAENNPMVCGAWDVYVDEHNEDDFRDTLMRCYQRLDGVLSSSSKHAQNSSGAMDKVYSDRPSEEKSALRRFVLWLHTQNRISTEEGQQLMARVDAGAPSAEKAMKRYLASERLETDGDRLMKVVMSLLYGNGEEDAGTSEDDEEEEAYVIEEKGEDDDDEREIRRGLEDTYGENPEEDEALRETIILFLEDLCENKQVLTRRNVERLTALVDAGDQRLLAAFDLFNDERDLDDLVDTLQRLAEKVVIVGEDEEDDGPDTQDDEDDDGEDDDDVYDFKSLFNIIAKMGLNLSQLEMIRDGMEMKHPGMEEAIDNFAQTGDQEAFKNDLVSWCDSQL